MTTKLDYLRAEALFVSSLNSQPQPSTAQVRKAVSTSLSRYGRQGCTSQFAGEYGEHPDTAPTRMTWALRTVRTCYSNGNERQPSPAA